MLAARLSCCSCGIRGCGLTPSWELLLLPPPRRSALVPLAAISTLFPALLARIAMAAVSRGSGYRRR